jgi:hypothetical protein
MYVHVLSFSFSQINILQPEPIKNLNELIKAQLLYFSVAAEALSSVQGEIEELSVAAEGEYR